MNPILIIAAIVVVILIVASVIFMLSSKQKTVVADNGVTIAPGGAATVVAVGAHAIMGKTVTIHRKSGAGGISLAEVILRGPDGKRLSPANATSSSKFSIDGKFDPDKLIDADFGTSARTADPPAPGEVPVITLDMGKDVPISTVEIATGGAPASGLAITIADSSRRQVFGNTIKVDRPYYAFAPAGAKLPAPMSLSGKLESFSPREVVGRYVHASSFPKIFDNNGLQLNAAKVAVTKGAAPVYSVDLGSNKGIGRINLAGRGGEHSIVVKSARGDVTYTAAVKKN